VNPLSTSTLDIPSQSLNAWELKLLAGRSLATIPTSQSLNAWELKRHICVVVHKSKIVTIPERMGTETSDERRLSPVSPVTIPEHMGTETCDISIMDLMDNCHNP